MVQCSSHSSIAKAAFYSTVAMIGFWFSGILLLLYLFHAVYVFNKIPWMKVEFFFCGAMTILLLIASALLAAIDVHWFLAAAVSYFSIITIEITSDTIVFNFRSIFLAVFRLCSDGRLWI